MHKLLSRVRNVHKKGHGFYVLSTHIVGSFFVLLLYVFRFFVGVFYCLDNHTHNDNSWCLERQYIYKKTVSLFRNSVHGNITTNSRVWVNKEGNYAEIICSRVFSLNKFSFVMVNKSQYHGQGHGELDLISFIP